MWYFLLKGIPQKPNNPSKTFWEFSYLKSGGFVLEPDLIFLCNCFGRQKSYYKVETEKL